MLRKAKFVFATIQIIAWLEVRGLQASPTCSLDTGKPGNKDSVRLAIYDCVKATSSSQAACGGRPKKEVVLEKGETVDIYYDVNDYAVLAKFFGEEVCVSFREKRITRGVSPSRSSKCKSKCFTSAEEETYHSDFFCSYQSCGGGKKKLRFLVVSSGKSVFKKSVSVMIAVIASFSSLYMA